MECVSQVSGGRAFLSDFIELRPRIERFLRARTGSNADAEEVLQDTWIKLENRCVEGIDNPEAYIYRTAENCLRDRIRSRNRRTNREATWSEAQFGGNQAADHMDAERLLISREELAFVERALDHLPERTSYVFRAFRLGGRKQKELADELDISLSAIEKHLQRAYAAVIAARESYNAEKE